MSIKAIGSRKAIQEIAAGHAIH